MIVAQNKKISYLIFLSIAFFLLFSPLSLLAQTKDSPVCAVYFTGVGCAHCARTDPVILEEALNKYPQLIILEYEIYQQRANAPLLYEYNSNYQTGLGIPLLIFNRDKYYVGDRPILNNLELTLTQLSVKGNNCLLVDGQTESLAMLNLHNLPGQIKIWTRNRVLLFTDESKRNSGLSLEKENEALKNLLFNQQLDNSLLVGANFQSVEPIAIPLSGKKISFNRALTIGQWRFQWNGNKLIEEVSLFQSETIVQEEIKPELIEEEKISSLEEEILLNDEKSENEKEGKPADKKAMAGEEEKQPLTFAKIISLALVDAVNPCALAVLFLMLIAILTYNPRNKKKLLLAGLSFVGAVLLMYFIYGLVIIKCWQLIQAIVGIKLWLYRVLGGLAIILGLFNLRDFIRYRPGGLGTEMPLFLRPKLKKIISGVTSPTGAFVVGLFVTLFLLPCTIGPYVIAGGILSSINLLATLPWLLLYDLIFVLPMLIIVGLIYAGISKIDDLVGWKDKNIRYLHLIAGIIILVIGVLILLGLV